MDIFVAFEIAARIWGDPEYSGYSMNPELAEKIAYLLLEEANLQSHGPLAPGKNSIMETSFYIERAGDEYIAWRDKNSPRDECGRGKSPYAAIHDLLHKMLSSNHAAQPSLAGDGSTESPETEVTPRA